MSYDIYLFEKQFLRRALDEGLGDWTGADPIPEEKLQLIRENLNAKGYVGEDDGFEHANSNWRIQVSIFRGEVSFTMPLWEDVEAAIVAARADAIELATKASLGFYDPQIGEAIT